MNTQLKNNAVWLLLPTRTIFFLVAQAFIALMLLIVSGISDWQASAAWWPMAVALADIFCLFLLIRWYRKEGKNFFSEFRIVRESFWKDLGFVLLSLVIGGPLSVLPNILLSTWLFGNPEATLELFVGPLPLWAVIISAAFFPLGQALTEIPMYMRYIAPKFENKSASGYGLKPWLAIGLASIFLSLQHITAPLVFDLRFILWRALMYLPFAIYVGILIRWRPRLLPFICIIHLLMNLSFVFMYMVPNIS
ncbi:MAG: hypothetical protein IH585_03010 [Anaerolineaceae bacterium]|nr:hypothetical protein [Anaerolineaceae bacterium]